jgi:FkbM family methyltransferase
MNIFESIRNTANQFGFDVCRVGRARLGRLLARDLIALSPGDGLIFDVGANTGRAARFFSKVFPSRTIWSFEPGGDAFSQLSVASDLRQVKKFNLALSDREETATLHVFYGSQLNSLLPHEANAERYDIELVPEGTEPVQTTRLDTFCQQHQIPKIEILKIDTQGFELHVLRGAERLLNSGSIHLIFLEVNFVPLYQGQPAPSAIFDLLGKFGYGLIGLYDASREQNGCIKSCDFLFKLNREFNPYPQV